MVWASPGLSYIQVSILQHSSLSPSPSKPMSRNIPYTLLNSVLSLSITTPLQFTWIHSLSSCRKRQAWQTPKAPLQVSDFDSWQHFLFADLPHVEQWWKHTTVSSHWAVEWSRVTFPLLQLGHADASLEWNSLDEAVGVKPLKCLRFTRTHRDNDCSRGDECTDWHFLPVGMPSAIKPWLIPDGGRNNMEKGQSLDDWRLISLSSGFLE